MSAAFSTPSVERPNRGAQSGAAQLSNPNDFAPWRPRGPLGRVDRRQDHAALAEQQVDAVLTNLKRQWNFMIGKDCLPAHTALQFLDESSLGLVHRHDEFHAAQEELQSALRKVVNEHFQGFNSSIGTYHQLTAGIDSAQRRIRGLRAALSESKAALTSAKTEFSTIFNHARDYSSQLEAVRALERIQLIPDILEAQTTEKQFLAAVQTVDECTQLLQSAQLKDLHVLGAIKVQVANQEHLLSDILIEELHNHLYLKSPYCEGRWSQYAKSYLSSADASEKAYGSIALNEFLTHLEAFPRLTDELAVAEVKSFQYIQTVVESLYRLGKLDDAIETVEQRLPVELSRVREKTTIEIQQRHPDGVEARPDDVVGQLDLDGQDPNRDLVLRDLLATLFAKFEAIGESFRAFHEVVEGICKDEQLQDASRMTRTFGELWKIYQSEIRSLLHNNISASNQLGRLALGLASKENILRQQREKSKASQFKMEGFQSGRLEQTKERGVVEKLWLAQVPGLTSLAPTEHPDRAAISVRPSERITSGHTALVRASVFNIICLLPPTAFFLRRLKGIVPPTSSVVRSDMTSFLNDFLSHVFQPQLEETIAEYCSQSFLQADAYQKDSRFSQYARKPVAKCAIIFSDTISMFCKMLAALTHDQTFSQLILTQMNSHYDRCCAWYNDLVTRSGQNQKTVTIKAADLSAIDSDLSDTVGRLMDILPSVDDDLVAQETRSLVEVLASHDPESSISVADRRTRASLCLLFTSLKWLSARIAVLRHISPTAIDRTGLEDQEDTASFAQHQMTALTYEYGYKDIEDVYLPLNERTAALFDGILEGFEHLASNILKTLHLELRCMLAQNLRNVLSGSFIYSNDADAPHEEIVSLTQEILELHRELKSSVQTNEYSCIVTGVGNFADAMLLQYARSGIRSMNSNGCRHMLLNVQVLHHSLLQLEPACKLTRTEAFFALFLRGPDAILADASALGKDDSELLLKLWYSEQLDADRSEEVVRGKKSLEEKLAQLESMYKG